MSTEPLILGFGIGENHRDPGVLDPGIAIPRVETFCASVSNTN